MQWLVLGKLVSERLTRQYNVMAIRAFSHYSAYFLVEIES